MTAMNPGSAAAVGALAPPGDAAGAAANSTAMSATNATALRKLVTSWTRLLTRMPNSCSAVKPAIEAAPSSGPLPRPSSTAYSPNVMAPYATNAVLENQSAQPTTKPARAPSARRA
jgi:hypothetical protein